MLANKNETTKFLETIDRNPDQIFGVIQEVPDQLIMDVNIGTMHKVGSLISRLNFLKNPEFNNIFITRGQQYF